MTDQVMAEQIRKDFVANASHELRTPLTLILGYIETLREGVDGDPEFIAKCLGIMEKHGQRIVRIIDDMLTISRLEGTSGILNIEPFPVRDCVQDAVDRLAPILEGRDTQVILDFPDSGGIINGDRF
ncbi:MAG: two-component sensor histidine kinase, partial [Actinobacteria bacterium]|nr:two-component sensor histidine kinase [Actinomycetota bacterium]